MNNVDIRFLDKYSGTQLDVLLNVQTYEFNHDSKMLTARFENGDIKLYPVSDSEIVDISTIVEEVEE